MIYTGLRGSVIIKSNLNIIDLGKIISEKIFGGLSFEGIERNIYDEVPAIFIDSNLLGLSIVLSGNEGMEDAYGYCLEIRSEFDLKEVKRNTVNLSAYFSELLNEKIANSDIVIERR